MIIDCPVCKKPALYSPENPFRPFCSERCKLIDLGAWAEGKYAVAAEKQDGDEEESAPTEPSESDEDF